MKKLTLCLAATLAAACFRQTSFAQLDSSWLDAGNIRIKRDFTQSISIRGTDLEKMPFTSLTEAINVWLYGAYSNRQTMIYVVDGNPLSDVNAYSIHDIEEVIFVQNAPGSIECHSKSAAGGIDPDQTE